MKLYETDRGDIINLDYVRLIQKETISRERGTDGTWTTVRSIRAYFGDNRESWALLSENDFDNLRKLCEEGDTHPCA